MNVFEFVVGLSLISTVGWIANNWIRARHGFEPEAEEELFFEFGEESDIRSLPQEVLEGD